MPQLDFVTFVAQGLMTFFFFWGVTIYFSGHSLDGYLVINSSKRNLWKNLRNLAFKLNIQKTLIWFHYLNSFNLIILILEKLKNLLDAFNPNVWTKLLEKLKIKKNTFPILGQMLKNQLFTLKLNTLSDDDCNPKTSSLKELNETESSLEEPKEKGNPKENENFPKRNERFPRKHLPVLGDPSKRKSLWDVPFPEFQKVKKDSPKNPENV